MRIFTRCIFFAVLLVGVFVVLVKADTVYTYVGDKFTSLTGVYVQGDRVTGSFVLSGSYVFPDEGAGIYPVTIFVKSYSFTDGLQTWTQYNSTAAVYVGFSPNGTPIVPTDAAGVNSDWYVSITTPTGLILTEDYGGDYQTYASTDNSSAEILSLNGYLYPGGPGTWSVQVPEGGTTALYLFAGLAGLTILRWSNGLKRVPLPRGL